MSTTSPGASVQTQTTLVLLSIVCFFIFFVLLTGISNADPLDDWNVRNSPVNAPLFGITYGNGMFVAVGSAGTIVRSFDGTIWLESESGTSSTLLSVTYGNGIYVAVGDGGTILTSPDAVTWTERSSGYRYLESVIYGNGMFVAVGWDYTPHVNVSTSIMTSADGLIWRERSWSTSRSALRGVAYGNGMFAAVGEGIMTSSDGLTWKWIAKSEGDELGNSDLLGIAFVQDTFVAVGSPGVIFTSTDGQTWTQRPSGSFDALNALAYGNGAFVIVGGWVRINIEMPNTVTILTSSDGIGWQEKASGLSEPLYGIAFGKDTFVAVGGYMNSSIIQSSPVVNATDSCISYLSPSLSLNIPIIEWNSTYLSAELQYEWSVAGTLFRVTKAGTVRNPGDFRKCPPATLTFGNTYKLHVPAINFDNVLYQADFEYVPTNDNQVWFNFIRASMN